MSDKIDNLRPKYQITLLLIAFLAIWLPRTLTLDQFTTIDERKWLTRSANFYYALGQGAYADTFQREHPGVTILWSGAAGFRWQFPEHLEAGQRQVSDDGDVLSPYLLAQGHRPIDLLAAGRFFVALAISIALTLAFVSAKRLLGLAPAALAFGLIAFDPFSIGLSHLLHLDAMLSSWMLLSALSFLCYLYDGQQGRGRWYDLALSGVAAGMAWLTKSPGFFLIPYVGLLLLLQLIPLFHTKPRQQSLITFGGTFITKSSLILITWMAVAVVTFALFWPAMWVDPIGSITRIFDVANEYASAGHSNPIFFNGKVLNGDPGFIFYPLTYLWRTTPITMLGLLFFLLFAILRSSILQEVRIQRVAIALSLFVLFFFLFMNLGAKKFDRYFLPVYAPLNILAGLGWAGLAQGVFQFTRNRAFSRTLLFQNSLFIAPLAIQLSLMLWFSPYYLSYYNPLLGGSERAPEVMMIGWGEGLDQAGRYLNDKLAKMRIETEDETAQLEVASWYRNGSFSYFFDGPSHPIHYYWQSDYALLYEHQWQRQLPARRLLSFFDQQPAEQTFWINGIRYARLYDVKTLPAPDFAVEWDSSIRLVSYNLPALDSLPPNQRFWINFYLVNLKPIDKNLNMLVRVVNADGHELYRGDGWPYGSPTSIWKKGEMWPDGHRVTLAPDTPPGIYRAEVSFYDPETMKRLPVTSVKTGQPLQDPITVDYLTVGNVTIEPQNRLIPIPEWGGKIALRGFKLYRQEEIDVNNVNPLDTKADGEETWVAQLFWESTTVTTVDYTAFMHLVGPDGTIVAQRDQQPLNGFVPISLWYPGLVVQDEIQLTLPKDRPIGDYSLYTGFYDLETLQRLPILIDGQASGDSLLLTTISDGSP